MKQPYIFGQFLREGSSDDGLLSILNATIINLGFDSNSQILPAAYPTNEDAGCKRKTVEAGINNILQQMEPDVIFVHRDADNEGVANRRQEILGSATDVGIGTSVIPVIPVKETEAWILWALHHPSFRATISGMDDIAFPSRKTIEGIAAKEQLREVHKAWANKRGGKRNNTDRFERDRSVWLERINNVMFLQGCPSFESLYEDCKQLLDRLE